MPVFDRVDAPLYDLYQPGIAGDVEFYVQEATGAGAVLELGCGTARITIPIAEAGVPVVGLDRAPAMLEIARDKIGRLAPATRARIELLEGDMRAFALGRRFDLVIIPYRAFLHLLTVEDQRACLAAVRAHLGGGGRLIVNFFDPDLSLIGPRLARGYGPSQTRAFTHPVSGRRVLVWERFTYDPVRQLVDGGFTFEELDRSGKVAARTEMPLTLRWIHRYEMQHLLEREGFTVDALYGDFRRGPHGHATEQIWVARA
ncbi:MAG: class I SAM-dependent methyltransferase [Candidatus Rokubacteria bacterium]|nr:class I SAM-dependent methyltransferase [Candidatus Rokubacteria bacterium]